MPPVAPSTEVFSFSDPKIKGGEIHFAICLGAGVSHVLRASRSVWQHLHDKLSAEFSAPAARPSSVPKADHRRYLRGVDRTRVYSEVLLRIEKDGLSRKAACQESCVGYNAFAQWLKEHHAREASGYRPPTLAETVAAARQPIAKPSGRLL